MRLNSLLLVTPMIFSTVAFFNQADTKASSVDRVTAQMTVDKQLSVGDVNSVSVGFYRKKPKKTSHYSLLNTPVDYAPTRQQLQHIPVYFPPVDVENYYLGQLYRNISGTLIFGRYAPSHALLERRSK